MYLMNLYKNNNICYSDKKVNKNDINNNCIKNISNIFIINIGNLSFK